MTKALETDSNRLSYKQYLFCKGIGWCSISITLAIDGGFSTSTNGIHLPVSVVIVHNMEVSVSTPGVIIDWNLVGLIKSIKEY